MAKEFLKNRVKGVIFYDISKDAVIVKFEIPCFSKSSDVIQDAADKAMMSFVMEILKEVGPV